MGTRWRLRPLSVWADFCLCLPGEDLLFTLPTISVSPTGKQKWRKEWGGEKLSLLFLSHVQGEVGEGQRRHQGKLWGRSQLLLPTQTHSQSSVQVFGWAVPSVSPGRDVQRDSLCRPGQALVFYQRVLQGGLLVATKKPGFEEQMLWQCAVNLPHSQLELLCPWRTHSPWNRHCMDTGKLSAAKGCGYTASHL